MTPETPLELVIDDLFTIAGRGIVVSASLKSGSGILRKGQLAHITGEDLHTITTRVTGVEFRGNPHNGIYGFLLRDVETDQLKIGMTVTFSQPDE